MAFVRKLCLCWTVLAITGTTIMGDNSLFRQDGLVWIENFHGYMYFYYMNLTSDTWKKESSVQGPKPSPVILARTEEFSFTHLDVAVGQNKTFVMVDPVGQRIVAFSFNEKGQHKPWVLFQGTSKKVNGIAINWVTEVVYWTDAAYDAIMVAALKYPHYGKVAVDNLDEPYGIVVHPVKGFLFWTDADRDNPRLMRSSLGGQEIHTVIRFFTGIGTALHLDIAEDRLYWLFEMEDQSGQRISSCDLYGNYKVDTKVAGNPRYFDMDIFNDQMIFVNQNENQIDFYSKKRSDKHYKLVLDAGYKLKMDETPYGLRVIDYYGRRSQENPCTLSTCPGICTSSNNGTEDCFCIDALKKVADKRDIRTHCGAKSFNGILLPKRDGIYTIWKNFGENKITVPESVIQLTRVFGEDQFINTLTSDIRTSKIYFFDYNTKVIKSVRTEEGSEAETVSLAVGNVWGLAYDGVSRNLYWTDSEFGHIMVTNEYGEHPFVLHDDLDQPMEIAVHPIRRKLYWSQEYSGILHGSNLDGSNRTEVQDFGKRRIKGIAIDFKTDMIYVCTRTSVIQVRETDDEGHKYSVLYTHGSHTFTGIAVMHDYLVVSDTDYRISGLYKFEKPEVGSRILRLAGKATFSNLRLGNFYGVSYHHNSNQPDRQSLCKIRKPDCDQLCLSSRRHVRCVCGLGFITNGSRCEIDFHPEMPFNPFLFVADQRYGKLFHVHALNKQFIAIPVQGLRQPYAITYDPIKRKVYWSDLDTMSISRSDIDGQNQEIIVYDPYAYFVCLEFDPGSRLLFYIARHGHMSSSLLVYHVDTSHVVRILNRTLGDTRSIALNVNNGYIYLIEQGNLWRVNLNGTGLEQLTQGHRSTAVAIVGEYVYFTNVSSNGYQLSLRRTDLDGSNSTMIVSLKYSQVRDLTIDQDHLRIYWTNSTTRAIYSMPLKGRKSIGQIGPEEKLMKPAGLFLNTIRDSFESPCKQSDCDGICLPDKDNTICTPAQRHVVDVETGRSVSGLCTIPQIKNGDILNNKPGRVVPHGYTVQTQCYPLHSSRRDADETMTCRYGDWTYIPFCELEYKLCGTLKKGYIVYRESGVYFNYPEVRKVDVICIGGGGGGYDGTNSDVIKRGRAGDGKTSSFGTYLTSEGGHGGTKRSGGRGGFGHASGGHGQFSNDSCVTGGTAGQIDSKPVGRPGYSHYLFCGAGGYSATCGDIEETNETYAGPGGQEPEFLSAGNFGGGAGSLEGGSGGGGGWSRLKMFLEPREVVPVTVGEAGYPSYGHPAPGVVIVMWGKFSAEEQLDIIDTCIFD